MELEVTQIGKLNIWKNNIETLIGLIRKGIPSADHMKEIQKEGFKKLKIKTNLNAVKKLTDIKSELTAEHEVYGLSPNKNGIYLKRVEALIGVVDAFFKELQKIIFPLKSNFKKKNDKQFWSIISKAEDFTPTKLKLNILSVSNDNCK
jgi:hypothetical protein